MAYLTLKNINKIYPNGYHAVHNFNLEIEKGEFVVFVGPSGCGKSTTLRMIAGLEDISNGEFLINGKRANEMGPREREVAMVFQSYALYPQMTVFDNIAFGLTLQGVDEDIIEERVKNINKIYPNGYHAVHNFNLEIEKGEFVVFVGPSGCGKSTTLRMIAGLEDISNGEFLINGKRANEMGPREREVAMVFQSYALYPQMTVYDNIAFGLTLQGVDEDVIEKRVQNTARILGLTDYLDRLPRALSGGQRQRVAIGRAIIRKVGIFLMDEPLSNLDAKQRVTMRYEIAQIHRETGATTIYVTHDQTEAMTLADRIVVMKDGYVQQVGTP